MYPKVTTDLAARMSSREVTWLDPHPRPGHLDFRFWARRGASRCLWFCCYSTLSNVVSSIRSYISYYVAFRVACSCCCQPPAASLSPTSKHGLRTPTTVTTGVFVRKQTFTALMYCCALMGLLQPSALHAETVSVSINPFLIRGRSDWSWSAAAGDP